MNTNINYFSYQDVFLDSADMAIGNINAKIDAIDFYTLVQEKDKVYPNHQEIKEVITPIFDLMARFREVTKFEPASPEFIARFQEKMSLCLSHLSFRVATCAFVVLTDLYQSGLTNKERIGQMLFDISKNPQEEGRVHLKAVLNIDNSKNVRRVHTLDEAIFVDFVERATRDPNFYTNYIATGVLANLLPDVSDLNTRVIQKDMLSRQS